MPLTKAGKKLKRKFMKQYGSRGKEVFYAYERKHPELDLKIERRRKKYI